MYCVRTSTLIGSIWNAWHACRDRRDVGDARLGAPDAPTREPLRAEREPARLADDSCAERLPATRGTWRAPDR